MTTASVTIQTAIDDSIRENRIVSIDATLDTQEWVDLANGLSLECDDWTESNGNVREYWGTDEDGDKWRIHLRHE
jgi:hypothetical protein